MSRAKKRRHGRPERTQCTICSSYIVTADLPRHRKTSTACKVEAIKKDYAARGWYPLDTHTGLALGLVLSQFVVPVSEHERAPEPTQQYHPFLEWNMRKYEAHRVRINGWKTKKRRVNGLPKFAVHYTFWAPRWLRDLLEPFADFNAYKTSDSDKRTRNPQEILTLAEAARHATPERLGALAAAQRLATLSAEDIVQILMHAEAT